MEHSGSAASTEVVKSADRALAIVEFVADRGPQRFQDVTEALGLARSSAHGLLRTLVARGWLAHDPVGRVYSLGLSAWRVGRLYTGHVDLVGVAQPVMDALAADVGETVQLARLDGVENVYLAISESPHPFRMASSVGARLASHATALGKVLLAQLPSHEVRARLEAAAPLAGFTERTVTVPADVLVAVERARSAGHALDEGEYLRETRCVAVPLLDDGAGLVTAMSITTPVSRCPADWPDTHLPALVAAAADVRARYGLSGRLPGHAPPASGGAVAGAADRPVQA